MSEVFKYLFKKQFIFIKIIFFTMTTAMLLYLLLCSIFDLSASLPVFLTVTDYAAGAMVLAACVYTGTVNFLSLVKENSVLLMINASRRDVIFAVIAQIAVFALLSVCAAMLTITFFYYAASYEYEAVMHSVNPFLLSFVAAGKGIRYWLFPLSSACGVLSLFTCALIGYSVLRGVNGSRAKAVFFCVVSVALLLFCNVLISVPYAAYQMKPFYPAGLFYLLAHVFTGAGALNQGVFLLSSELNLLTLLYIVFSVAASLEIYYKGFVRRHYESYTL